MSFQSSNIAGGGGGSGDGGVLSVGAFGAAPSTTGATIAGTVITMTPADATRPGELKAADWVTFNGKQAALTLGNLTSTTTGLTVTGGTGAVVGSGTSVALPLTTNGDTLYYNSGLQRLAKGTDGQVLTLASGIPSWAAAGGGSGIPTIGTSTDTALVTWNSTAGAAVNDSSLLLTSYSLKGKDDISGGAGVAPTLTISASQKTSGTGSGGDLVLRSGHTSGGNYGTPQIRFGTTALGANLVYPGGFQLTGNGSATQASFSWTTYPGSGMFNSSGNPVLVSNGVVVGYFGNVGAQANIQMGTASGTIMANGGNDSGLGYYSTTLKPFKDAYFGTGVVGIGVASGATTQYSANALLDIQSTTKGVLFPRMTTTQKNAVTAAEGMIVYDLTLHKLAVYTGSAWETVTSI